MTKSKTSATKSKTTKSKTATTKATSSKSTKTTGQTASSKQMKDQFSINNNGFNIFDSDMYEDIRHFWSDCLKSSNKGFCMSAEHLTDNNTSSQKALNSMKDVMAKATNQNIQLGMESLSCKTAADFMNLYKKAFNVHFDNMSKFYNEAANFCHHCHEASCKHMSGCLKG